MAHQQLIIFWNGIRKGMELNPLYFIEWWFMKLSFAWIQDSLELIVLWQPLPDCLAFGLLKLLEKLFLYFP